MSIEANQYGRQLALENNMLQTSKTQFWKDIAKAKEDSHEEDTYYGVKLLRESVLPVAAAVSAFLADIGVSGKGKRPVAFRILSQIEPEVAAFIALRVSISSISKQRMVQAAAVSIGQQLEDELMMRTYADMSPEVGKNIDRAAAKRPSYRNKKAVATVIAAKANLEFTGWSKVEKLHTGMKMIELIQNATGLIEVTPGVTGKDNSPMLVTATPKCIEWIGKANGTAELLSPQYWPTICAPKAWTSPIGGGYYSRLPQALSFVKTRNRNYIEELTNTDLTSIYAAANHVQNTAWRINTFVLDVIDEARAKKLAGIPVAHVPDPDDKPPQPADFLENEEARREWRKTAAIHYENGRRAASKATQQALVLSQARMLRDEPTIYFPHTQDFRGRMYALPLLSPQGADMTKALLTFAQGKPITAENNGGFWLAVHGANLAGYDKVSLEDREAWVLERTAEIALVATDPLGAGREHWVNRDKPWQFLAWAKEWTDALAFGEGFVSSLPVSMDGSCNGLQHFSAMLRDPVGGAAVNLIPADKPQDIYGRVAAVVTEKLRLLSAATGGDAKPGELTAAEWATRWLTYGVDRKVTKRPVMIVPYSGTVYSMRAYIEDAVREKVAAGTANPFEHLMVTEKGVMKTDGMFRASLFLAPLVSEAIGEVVVAAKHAMGWLKKAATLAAKQGLPVTWTTPDGFPVWQAYREWERKRIETKLNGRMDLILRTELPTIDRQKQSSGIAPNFVHSLDAAAMRMFINLAADNGIEHFAVVHDSFGTVAGDVDLMQKCLRESFVDLYSSCCPLEMLHADIAALLPEAERKSLPAVPAKGNLDLTEVRKSDFFFS